MHILTSSLPNTPASLVPKDGAVFKFNKYANVIRWDCRDTIIP